MVSDAARERKSRSETLLQKEGVPFIPHLPVVEDEAVQIRSPEDVAWRAMALNVVAVKGEGLGQKRVLEIVKEYRLDQAFTPNERNFVFDESPTEQDRIQFSWRYEAYWVLLWALHYVEELGRPDKVCDVEQAVRVMVDRSFEAFIQEAVLRNPDEILDATDLVYRYDWACVDARLNGRPTPADLNASVVVERHHALNWLVGYPDADTGWDDVSTDT